MKRCYKCGISYPLFMFHKDRRKFQLKIAKGKTHECRICTANRVWEGKIVRYNFTINKFELKEIKPNWINWFKIFIGWK